MKDMIALKSFRYSTRQLRAGDDFLAKDKDVRLLERIKRARLKPADEKQQTSTNETQQTSTNETQQTSTDQMSDQTQQPSSEVIATGGGQSDVLGGPFSLSERQQPAVTGGGKLTESKSKTKSKKEEK